MIGIIQTSLGNAPKVFGSSFHAQMKKLPAEFVIQTLEVGEFLKKYGPNIGEGTPYKTSQRWLYADSVLSEIFDTADRLIDYRAGGFATHF